jgi:hypothetical protein
MRKSSPLSMRASVAARPAEAHSEGAGGDAASSVGSSMDSSTIRESLLQDTDDPTIPKFGLKKKKKKKRVEKAAEFVDK